jgi:hypothetical protein
LVDADPEEEQRSDRIQTREVLSSRSTGPDAELTSVSAG